MSCSHTAAEEVGDRARVVVEQLLAVSDMAQRAGEGWPDAPATSELRTFLLDVVELAEANARRWNDLARRLDALAMDGAHVHLIDGTVVAAHGGGGASLGA